jgi:hypothetical protein
MKLSSFDELLRAARDMIESIRTGLFASFIAFDRQGQPVLFT